MERATAWRRWPRGMYTTGLRLTTTTCTNNLLCESWNHLIAVLLLTYWVNWHSGRSGYGSTNRWSSRILQSGPEKKFKYSIILQSFGVQSRGFCTKMLSKDHCLPNNAKVNFVTFACYKLFFCHGGLDNVASIDAF